jgi:hypothetical protein
MCSYVLAYSTQHTMLNTRARLITRVPNSQEAYLIGQPVWQPVSDARNRHWPISGNMDPGLHFSTAYPRARSRVNVIRQHTVGSLCVSILI